MSSSPELPARMARLPIDPARGVPVPWFVAWLDEHQREAYPGRGTPDFRVVRSGAIADAIDYVRCWLCGETLGAFRTFAIGPMCAVNRVSAEPPCHLECAEYAVRVCPFLVNPRAVRRETKKPDHVLPAGEMICRNPGVTLLWTTKPGRYHAAHAPDGVLFRLDGTPEHLRWYREGRRATRDEVRGSIDSGLPLLRKLCDDDPNYGSARAHWELDAQVARALKLVDATTEAP